MPGLSQIQLLKIMALTQQAPDPTSYVAPAPSQDDRALLAKTQDAADKSLSENYFLIKDVINGKDVYFIFSPTQSGQIVSEGMGYWMKIATNLSLIEGTADAKAAQNQNYFNGLLRGALMTLNKNGLPGWRCFYDPKTKSIEFKARDEKFSAPDADIYTAQALVIAQGLIDAGIWKETPGLDYGKLAEQFLGRIKGLDVITLKTASGAERYVLTVSDSWGEKDIKDYVTVNPSYGVLSAFVDFAKFDRKDSSFWLKLRKDTFDIIDASQHFGETMYAQARTDVFDNGDGTVRLIYQSITALRNLLAKITPLSDGEKAEFRQYGIKFNTNTRNPYFDLIVDRKGAIINKDGTWTIGKDTFNFIQRKIEEHRVKYFFPDQVEVGLRSDGKFDVRIEASAFNLDFTENYDAIRVYKELGEDALLHDDTKDPFFPQGYKISAREKALLLKVTAGRTPQTVRASKYGNIIARSCYFMAVQGNNRFDFERALINGSFFEAAREKPQYYHTSLTTLATSGYLAAGAKKGLRIPEATGPIEKAKREQEIVELPQYHPALQYIDFKSPSADYFLTSMINLGESIIPGGEKGVPEFKIQAQRRYHHFEEMYGKTPNDPEVIYLYAQSLLGIGEYHQARKVLFEATLKMLKNGEETSALWDFATDGSDKALMQCIADRSDVKEQKLMSLCIKLYADISKTLNIDEFLTADDMDWILENKLDNPTYRLYLRASFINKLNIKGRTTEALKEEIKFFEEYNSIYGKTPAGCGTVESTFGWFYSGENMRSPLPRVDILSSVTCDFVATLANMYKLGAPDGTGYQERLYYSTDALKLVDALLAGTPLPDTDNEKFNYVISLIRPFEGEISAASQTKLLTTKARAQLQSVYNAMDSVNARRTADKIWSDQVDLSSEDPKALPNIYKGLIDKCDTSIKVYRDALASQIAGTVQDKEAFLVIFDGLVDANMMKISLINKTNVHCMRFFIDPKEILGAEPEGLAKSSFDEVMDLYARVLDTFDSPFPGAVKQMFPIWPGSHNENIGKAARYLLDYSADPRNANYINWILKALSTYAMVGESTVGAAFSAGSEDLLKRSLGLSMKIPQIYVSNDEQRALFLFRSLLSVEDTIFFYRAQIKASSDPQLPALRDGAMLLFKALLGEKLSAEERSGISPMVRPVLEKINENRKQIDNIFRKNPAYKAMAYAKYGNLLWWSEDKKDHINEAKRAYETSLSTDPYNADALVGLAYCMFQEDTINADEILRLTVRALRVANMSQDPRLINSIKGVVSLLAKSRVFAGEEQEMIKKASDLLSREREVDPSIISEVLEIFKDIVR